MQIRFPVRAAALLLVLTLLTGTALADLGVIRRDMDTAVYGAVGEAGGYVVNMVPAAETVRARDGETPLDVVIVIDTSGSMNATASSGKNLLAFSTEAAEKFVDVLAAVNPSSRVGLVAYSGSARDVLPLTALSDRQTIGRALNSLSVGGNTNQTDGFEHAAAMLQDRRPEAQGLVLLLTDGRYNEGEHPRTAGYTAAARGLVYTVGLVGNLSETERHYVRDALACGYQTSYFEVDFDSMDGAGLNGLVTGFMSIAMAASWGGASGSLSSDGDPAEACYILRVDGPLDVRVAAEGSPDVLCSAASSFRDQAEFGSITSLGPEMEQKVLVLRPGHYGVTLQGTGIGQASYDLRSMAGLEAKETVLAAWTVTASPGAAVYLDVADGQCALTDLSWNPLDHRAIDPFTGLRTRGSRFAAAGTLNAAAAPAAWTEKGASAGEKLKKNETVQVLARDPDSGMYLIAFVTARGRLARGWVKDVAPAPGSYVPDLIRDDPAAYTVPKGTVTYRAPAETAEEAVTLPEDTGATLIHAEYDAEGREWAYLLLEGGSGRTAVYVQAGLIPGWTPAAPKDFRIAGGTPFPVWQSQLGEGGFTEVMWVASRPEGGGVAVSGRTSSKGGELKARYDERDAMALLVTSDGTVERAMTAGGTGLDSFHCIVPFEDGFYVSGVTRSNNKDFDGIWDAGTYSGKRSATTKRTNALIGRLDPDLSIRWMKSFGNGTGSSGFDMVVRLADGSIAGAGWMSCNKGFRLTTNGKQDFFAARLTENGDLLAMNNYGGARDDVPDSAAAMPEGGLIIVGNDGGDGAGSGLIVFTDAALAQTGTITCGTRGVNVFDNVRDLGDGTWLVTGYTTAMGRGGKDFWVLRIDGQGRTLWSKTYGGSKDDELRGTCVLRNGTAVLVGDTKSADGDVRGATGGGRNAWAVCIDLNGQILWQYTACVSGDNWFNSAAEDLSDGTLVLGGVCSFQSEKNARGFLVKLQLPQ